MLAEINCLRRFSSFFFVVLSFVVLYSESIESAIFLYNSLAAFSVKVMAAISFKGMFNDNAISRYLFTRTKVFPEPALAVNERCALVFNAFSWCGVSILITFKLKLLGIGFQMKYLYRRFLLMKFFRRCFQ